MADTRTAGREFLEQVLAKIDDPDKRTALQEALFASEAALTEAGSGALRQSEFSRSMDAARLAKEEADRKAAEAQEWHEKLNAWYAENQAKLKGGNPNPQPDPKPAPKPDDPKYLTADDLKAFGDEALGVMAVTNTLTATHMREFNEILDVAKLIDHARKTGHKLDDAYRDLFKDKLEARDKAVQDARDAKLKQEAIDEFRRANPQMPYPVRPAPSTLDVLESKADPTQYTTEAMVAEYERLAAVRNGTSGA